MSERVAHATFQDRKLVHAARRHIAWPGQKNRDVQTIREALADLDGHPVAAIHQRNAIAFERDQRDGRHLLGCSCDQRRRLWASCRGVLGPSTGLANVDEVECRGGGQIFRYFLEQRRFLSTGDCYRYAFGKRRPELVEFEPAELVGLGDPSRTGAADRLGIERHGFLACADHQMRRGITHHCLPKLRRRSPGCFPVRKEPAECVVNLTPIS